MPANFWEIVVAALVSGILGGGVIAVIGYRSLRDRLREDFEAKEDGKETRNQFEALRGLFVTIDDRVGKAEDDVLRLQESEKHRWEQVGKLLERISSRQDRHEDALKELEKGLERTALLLDQLEKRFARPRPPRKGT